MIGSCSNCSRQASVRGTPIEREMCRLLRRRLKQWKFCLQMLGGLFSALSTPNFATKVTKNSFCSTFPDLYDLYPFAPLRSKQFSKNSSRVCREWNNEIWFLHFRILQISSWKFDDILSEFRENPRKLTKCIEILLSVEDYKKNSENARISEIDANFDFSFHFFSRLLTNRKCEVSWAAEQHSALVGALVPNSADSRSVRTWARSEFEQDFSTIFLENMLRGISAAF